MMWTKIIIITFACALTKSEKSPTKKPTKPSTTLLTTENFDFSTTTIEPPNISTLASCDSINGTNSSDICTLSINTTAQSDITNGSSTNINGTKKNKEHKFHVETNICTCNLQGHICDMNCCCDRDCSAKEKSVFKYCEIDENRYFDDRYCSYVQQIYVNNTPFEWQVNQDGLFCAISSNLPKLNSIQNEKPFSSLEEHRAKVHFWQRHDQQINSNKLKLKNYKFGDPIMIVKNDSTIDTMTITKNFLVESCVLKEEVLYLKNDEGTCRQFDVDENNAMLSFATYFRDFKVIVDPQLVNLTKWKPNFYRNCPKNICIEIEPKLCDIHLNECSRLDPKTNIKFQCFFDLRSNVNNCQNAIRKIHYKFHHNATFLHKIEVLGALSNFSYDFGGDFRFFQDFFMEFVWLNHTKNNYSQLFSGNPGYIFGKPILLGTKLVDATILIRNSSDFVNNFLVAPKNVDGKCVKNQSFYTPIEFGYNLITKCSVAIEKGLKNVKNNASEMCKNIQKNIVFDLWNIPAQENRSLIFGIFGNALEENWNEVFYKTKPILFLNNIQGTFLNNKNTTLTCYNLSRLIDIEIFYSRIDLKSVLNQNKILGVSFGFNDRFIQTFNVFVQNSTRNVLLEVTSRASFYDVTKKKVKKFVDAPSFQFRLPRDFFYPFIKVGNTGGLFIMPNYDLVVTAAIIVVYLVV